MIHEVPTDRSSRRREHMPPLRLAAHLAGIAEILLGIAMISKSWGTGDDPLTLGETFFVAGTVTLVGAALWHAIVQRFKPWADVWEHAYEAGYACGSHEGRRAPRLMSIKPSCDSPEISAQQ